MEWYKTDCGKYRIESLTAATFPGALEVIRKAFFQEEAVSVGCEINKNPLSAEEGLGICADAALDGVSLVAITTDTGEVAAVAFNKISIRNSSMEKSFEDFFLEECCTQPETRGLVEFAKTIGGRCNLLDTYKVDCSFDIMYMATLFEHRNHKLGTHLCRISVDLAKQLKNGPISKITLQDLGPKYSIMRERPPLKTYPKICTSVWSSKGTQKIGQKLNFIVVLSIPMTDFIYNGKTYAERLGKDAPKFCELVALPLY